MMKHQYKQWFHTFIFAYIYLMMALCIPSNFAVTAPYKTRSSATLITIDGVIPNTNLHIVSVISMKGITPFQRMIYELSDELDVRELTVIDQQISSIEELTRGQVQKQSAYELSIIHGYQLAAETNPLVEIDFEFVGMVVDYRYKKFSQLQIGDIITKINGQSYANYEDMRQTFATDYDVDLTIKRQNTEVEVELKRLPTDIYFSFYPKYNILSATPSYETPGLNLVSGGPSSGMIQTLAIYLSLINDMIVDEIVVGTGTITNLGTVGEIGGLKQKVYTAIHEGIKYFICPASQYDEVAHLDGQGIEIYGVSTIEEAVEALHEIFI